MDAQVAVVHASLRGRVAAYLSPTLILALGALGLADGLRPVPVVLAVVGIALAGVVALDLPRRVEFRPEGIERVCLLRRHRLAWDDVRALERARGSVLAARRLRDGPEVARGGGGLVARGRGARRWLLTDRIESQPEYDRVRALVERHAGHVAITARRPPVTAAPTVRRPHRSSQDR